MGRPGLGIKAIFALVGSTVAGSLYFSLGVVTDHAREWTPLVFLVAGVFFLLAAMTYAEGASLYKERGGSTVLARHAFNELVSFIAGWAILIDYLILLALCSFTAVNYAATFWSPLGDGKAEVACAVAIICYVAVTNTLGVSIKRLPWVAILVGLDLLLQVAVIILGLILVFDPHQLIHPLAGVSPKLSDVIFALTIATVAFPGLEAASGFSSDMENRSPWYLRLIRTGAGTVLFTYISFALLVATALPLAQTPGSTSGRAVEAPVVTLVNGYGPDAFGNVLMYVVAGVATLLLIAAASATMLGLSRISYSLAINSQIPKSLGWLHYKHATPYVTIVLAAALACALVVPADLEMLVGVYAFGAMLAATVAHVSICVLRYREPDRERLFKIPFSIKVGGGKLPIPAVLGALASAVAWVSVIVLHEGARTLGSIWMITGLLLYVVYRKQGGRSLTRRVELPESALREDPKEAEYGSILVPVLGTYLDDDIMQTAGRLAAESRDDSDRPVAIEAIWIFEMPIAVPIDAELPEAQVMRAQEALARAKAIGEEYDGVTVHTHSLRSRRAGKAIVDEAAKRGIEVIVMAAEEQSRIGGGALLGSISGQRDNFVGEVTKYVAHKAGCRVILTAPAAETKTI